MRLTRILVASILAFSRSSHAVPEGSLDLSFGASGRVVTSTGAPTSEPKAIARQPDGKLIVVARTGFGGNAGDFGVFRYLSSGMLDVTFGMSGRVVTDVTGLDDAPAAVALQPDGKIVVAGGGHDDFAVLRYLADGTLDGTFGTGGTVVTDVGGHADRGYGVAIQSDGRIVVGGFADAGAAFSSSRDRALVRYLGDGTLDASFGTGGRVITPTNEILLRNGIYALAVQADGRILAGGVSEGFTLLRYLPDGTVDGSFSASSGEVQAIVVQPDAKILTGTGPGGGAVYRFASDGSSDAGFPGYAGLGGFIWGGGLVLQADGKILVTSRGSYPDEEAFVVGRVNANGSTDTAFGTNGINVLTAGSGSYGAVGLAGTPDGRAVAIGSFGYGSSIALVGYLAGTCGNGTLEAGEECDDGNLAPADGCDPNCCLVDSDGDGACDSNDPCTGGVTATVPKVTIAHFEGTDPYHNAGDETLSLSGEAVFPHPFAPSLDPRTRGARLRVFSSARTVVDVAAAPGAYDTSVRRGWKVNGGGTKWTYVDRSVASGATPPGSITTLVIQDLSSRSPGRVRFVAHGKRGRFETLATELPLALELVVDAPVAATGQCAVASFPGPPPVPSCRIDPGRRKLLCS